MTNDIIKFLNFLDTDIEVSNIEIKDSTKYIHIQKIVTNKVCPLCGSIMYSKGIRIRNINHPVLQDGFKLILVLHQRKWRCANRDCNHYCNDTFSFLDKYKQSSNIVPYLILNEFKDLNSTATSIANRLNVSDTTVHYTFAKYIDMPRLPLSHAISIDEVYMKFDKKNLYSLIIMDFSTGQIIDMLPNRKDNVTSTYFTSISKQERDNVKYLICDMYNPYINFVGKYFKNAIVIVDSFHVIQWLINNIRNYLNSLKKKFKEQDKNRLLINNDLNNKSYKSIEECKELYLLNNFSFFVLSNVTNIKYSHQRKYNRKFKMYLDTYQLENLFFDIDPNLKKIRDLKEIYIKFNNTNFNSLDETRNSLESIINLYFQSEFSIFKDFATLLSTYKEQIVNSFINITFTPTEGTPYLKRLSNGPIESFNNIPKDYKRICNGVANFEYTRNRILWATRHNPSWLASPKSDEEIYKRKLNPRGKYKK